MVGLKALFLGCSPAVNMVDFRLVDRDTTTVFAVNRIWHRTDPSKQRIFPDYLAAKDEDIERCWIPDVGLLKGFITRPGATWAARADAMTRGEYPMKLSDEWPAPGGEFLDASGTPPLAFQFVVEMGFPNIGILGIDYTGKKMANAVYQGRGGANSHWFGRHDKGLTAPVMGGPSGGQMHDGYAFWTRALQACRDRGIALWNLCPYAAQTPFHAAGIPTMPFEDWVAL